MHAVMLQRQQTLSSPVRQSRLFTLFLALVVFLSLGLTLATPSHAHDQLLESNPANGESLKSSPGKIVLTFSGEIKDYGEGVNEMAVQDEQENLIPLPALKVKGRQVTQPLDEPLPAGEYVVSWRVVSSDDHPISGKFSFTVKNDPAPTESPAPDESESSDASVPPDVIATPETNPDTAAPTTDTPTVDASAQQDESAAAVVDEDPNQTASPVWILIVVIIGIVVVAGGVGFFVLRRRDDSS